MSLPKKIMSIPLKFYNAITDVHRSVKTEKAIEYAEMDFIYGERVRTLPALISQDLKWAKPKGINRKFALKKTYIRDNDGGIKLYCFIDHPFTLDFSMPPKEDYSVTDLMDTEEDFEKLQEYAKANLVDFDDYKVTGGKETSEMVELIVTSVLLGILAPIAKKEILYVALMCFFAAAIIFFPAGMIFISILT